MDKCVKCNEWLINCPCCDIWHCIKCGKTEGELEDDEEWKLIF
jgi:hypothetical protein